MKKWIILFGVLLLMLPQSAYALLPEDVEDAIPGEAREILEDVGTDIASPEKSLTYFQEKIRELFPEILRENLRQAVVLLSIATVCSIVQSMMGVCDTASMKWVTAAGVIAVTLVSTREMESMMGVATQTIDELDTFSKALLPTLAAAVAAGGGVISAGVRQTVTILFADILLGLIHDLFLPLIYYYIAASAMNALLPEQNMGGLANGMKKVITWLLTGSLFLFTGYLTISGSAAASSDALSMRLTKSAISTAVPVVGGIISDATDSVLQSAGLLKNTLGIAGMLAVLSTCLSPFITIAIQYLLYKAAGFIAGMLGESAVCRYMSELGNAFGLVLGMVGSCAIMLLISISSCVSVVIT